MDSTRGADYDRQMRCATMWVAVASALVSATPSPASAQAAEALGDPTLVLGDPALEPPPEPAPPRRSLGAFYGSGWAGWSIGFGLGGLAYELSRL